MLKDNSLEEITVSLNRIIPFSNVEGEGNRCSIFLQGCNINCLFCHNPETIAYKSKDAKEVSLAYIVDEVKKSMPFIRGITVSGGEPTIHNKKLIPLFKEAHKLNLTTYLDSNGFFDFDNIKDLIDVTDKFLFDIKGLGRGLDRLCFDIKNKEATFNEEAIKDNPLMHKNLENLKRLLPMDKVEEVRLVHIKNFYDSKYVVERISEVLKDYSKVLFKLIRVHAKGARDIKYIAKNMPSVKEHNELAEYAKNLGLTNIKIIN